MTYGTSTHQQKLTCVDCHMNAPAPSQDGGATWANHSFYPQVSACISCPRRRHHLRHQRRRRTNQSRPLRAPEGSQRRWLSHSRHRRAATRLYNPVELTDAHFELDKTRPGGGPDGGISHLTPDQAGAVYNYIIVARGGALGVHNPKYTKQLIFDSYVAIKGLPPTTLVRPYT